MDGAGVDRDRDANQSFARGDICEIEQVPMCKQVINPCAKFAE